MFLSVTWCLWFFNYFSLAYTLANTVREGAFTYVYTYSNICNLTKSTDLSIDENIYSEYDGDVGFDAHLSIGLVISLESPLVDGARIMNFGVSASDNSAIIRCSETEPNVKLTYQETYDGNDIYSIVCTGTTPKGVPAYMKVSFVNPNPLAPPNARRLTEVPPPGRIVVPLAYIDSVVPQNPDNRRRLPQRKPRKPFNPLEIQWEWRTSKYLAVRILFWIKLIFMDLSPIGAELGDRTAAFRGTTALRGIARSGARRGAARGAARGSARTAEQQAALDIEHAQLVPPRQPTVEFADIPSQSEIWPSALELEQSLSTEITDAFHGFEPGEPEAVMIDLLLKDESKQALTSFQAEYKLTDADMEILARWSAPEEFFKMQYTSELDTVIAKLPSYNNVVVRLQRLSEQILAALEDGVKTLSQTHFPSFSIRDLVQHPPDIAQGRQVNYMSACRTWQFYYKSKFAAMEDSAVFAILSQTAKWIAPAGEQLLAEDEVVMSVALMGENKLKLVGKTPGYTVPPSPAMKPATRRTVDIYYFVESKPSQAVPL